MKTCCCLYLNIPLSHFYFLFMAWPHDLQCSWWCIHFLAPAFTKCPQLSSFFVHPLLPLSIQGPFVLILSNFFLTSNCCVAWLMSTFALFRVPASSDFVFFLVAALETNISTSGSATLVNCDCCNWSDCWVVLYVVGKLPFHPPALESGLLWRLLPLHPDDAREYGTKLVSILRHLLMKIGNKYVLHFSCSKIIFLP